MLSLARFFPFLHPSLWDPLLPQAGSGLDQALRQSGCLPVPLGHLLPLPAEGQRASLVPVRGVDTSQFCPRASGSRQRCPAGGCPGGRSRDWGFQQCSHSQYFPADLLQAAAQIPWSLLGALTLHSLDTAQHQLCLLLQEEGTDE